MGYNSDLCRVHRGTSHLWTTLTAGGLAAHHYALTVRACGLGIPVNREAILKNLLHIFIMLNRGTERQIVLQKYLFNLREIHS
jgi:hypothetical protein